MISSSSIAAVFISHTFWDPSILGNKLRNSYGYYNCHKPSPFMFARVLSTLVSLYYTVCGRYLLPIHFWKPLLFFWTLSIIQRNCKNSNETKKKYVTHYNELFSVGYKSLPFRVWTLISTCNICFYEFCFFFFSISK